MTKRQTYCSVGLLAAVLVLWLALHQKRVNQNVLPTTEPALAPSDVEVSPPTSVSPPPPFSSNPAAVATPSASNPLTSATGTPFTSQATTQEPPEKKIWRLLEKNPQVLHPPIEFYGKVVDERGQVVEGATVNLAWANLYMHENPHGTNALSDANGMFSLSGVEGATLSVHVSKEGYDADASSQGVFWYTEALGSERFRPDREEPVVFRLRTKGARQ